mgnify:FL=1
MSKQDELDKKDTRRGWATTLSVHAVLLIVFALFGLTYQDPPPEMGIPVNFGYEEDGAGETSAAPSDAASTPSASNPEVTEAAVTQDLVDAAAIPEKPKDKPKQTTTPSTTETQKPQEPEKPKVSNALSDRLKGGFTSTANPGTGSGQGNTAGSGDQGKPTGDLQGNGLGNGGTGNSGDYQLGSRKALVRPKPLYDCEGEGVVVVRIWVDRAGVVQRVEGGVSGSTTSQTCLVSRAEEAARKTRWEGDPAATDLQVGTIRYRFSRQ